MNYTIREREAEEAMEELVAERAREHQQESIHPLTVANELRALTDRVAKLKRQLTLMPHVEGLRECLIKAQVALEIGVVCVKEMEHE